MATYQILYWQEIPSLVEAKDGDDTEKRKLSDRYQVLIDAVAMRRGLAGTDEYLMHWRKGEVIERDGSAADVADSVAAELEDQFDDVKKAANDDGG